jgi:hypothetical protein
MGRSAWILRLPVRSTAAALGGLVLALAASRATALTPESPEVRRMVDRAIAFLESDAADDTRLGARALVGLALLKNGAEADHPKVVRAAEAIQRSVGRRDPAELTTDLYSTGLSIIFLVTLDPSRYAPEIECLLASLRLRQKAHGGWGYPERETGDTSMTQYGVLSAWEAAQEGFAIPQESIERVAEWLLRTQDPSGGFGYQGQVAEGNRLVKQQRVTQSMGAAGLGSTYIVADLLGLFERKPQQDADLPSALREVRVQDAGADQPDRPKTRIDRDAIRRAAGRGNIWMAANTRIDPKGWVHYYLYALERYWSFRELAEGKAAAEPRWYVEGARYLMNTQNPDGSWESRCKPTADTAFAVLFLLRSTKKSIEQSRAFGGGRMACGRGLPTDAARAAVRGGYVVAPPEAAAAEGFFAALEEPERDGHLEAVAALANLLPDEADDLCGVHGGRLRRLVREGSPAVRVAAIRALATADDLEAVPALIAALSDADAGVARAAEQTLRRISRRLEGLGSPARLDEAGRRQAVEEWKRWYVRVRPDAEFDD